MSDTSFRLEANRLNTFVNWPADSPVSPEDLAAAGFYYLGRSNDDVNCCHEDEVRCAFCKVQIMNWKAGDRPYDDHVKYAPQCPYVRQQNVLPRMANENAVVDTPGPAKMQFVTVSSRIKSFFEWPRGLRVDIARLAEAGFYYTGRGDKTKCFYCDGGLYDWESDDDPWTEHARWYSACPYVRLVKGDDYIQNVISSSACITADEKFSCHATIKSFTSDEDKIDNRKTCLGNDDNKCSSSSDGVVDRDYLACDSSKLCVVCLSTKRQVCFVPCGHVATCAQCVVALNKCPICINRFSSVIRLYFV